MMKLERLEISGFKSFVDPVGMTFGGGMTAIVGPNGCGKSNLADAVTWVLGEQSAKSLRGGRMEDVIFAGTELRKPLGMGEVNLTLATDPGFPAAEEGRLLLGRRVFRSGESQYRINGRLARLKEIKDLLMDTGLGIRAYSVIEQGKIGMILSGKPQERRKLLEEAAGITRYKARRRIAEVKLEEARANLLRLDDIVAEVERALRSLKRQAGAARRYRQQEGEYRELLRRVLTGRWALAAERLAALREELAARADDEARLAADLARDEAALAAGRETLDELAREVADRHQRQADLAAVIEGRQEFLKANRQRRGEIGERAAQARGQAERRAEEIAAAAEALAALDRRRAELAAERDQASAEVSRDEAAVAAAEARLQEAAARVEALRAELLAAGAAVSRLQGRRHQGEIELEKGNYRRHRLGREREEHAAEVAQATAAVEESRVRVAELEERLAARTAELERVERELAAVVGREGEADERRRETESALTESRQRAKLLAELGRAHAERRAQLERALAAAGLAEPAFLADRVRALAGWERSLDRYLGELTDAVVLAAGDDALGLARALAADPGLAVGAALVAPFAAAGDGDESAGAASPIDDPKIVLALGEALGLSEDLAAALPPAFLVEDPADAARLARAHPGVAFLCRGGVWTAGGVIHVGAAEASPGLLERERDLAALDAAIPRLETELQKTKDRLGRLVDKRAERAREANRLETEIAHLRQELAVAAARREDAEGRHRRLEEEDAELGAEARLVDGDLERLGDAQRDLAGELARAEEVYAELTGRLDRLEAALDAAKSERESLREASAGCCGRLELLAERLESHDREMDRLRRESAEGERQVALWRDEAARLDRAAGDLEAELARAESELQAALEGRAAAEEEVLAAQARLDAHRQGLRELEARIAAVREERDAVRAAAGDLKVSQAGLEQDAAHLRDTFREAFAEELPATAGETAPPAPPPHLAELEADLARTKDALERLGPVNVLAADEYAEQEERHTFLTTQRADVVRSVDSLKKTIREIDQTSSERFVATFAEVNRNFGKVFTQLFRGGEAEMRLLDDEDLLESGIEIVARPPGKRLQNIMLMSGGEKALTAIALLFALFQTKPSPFCILDEVDAPLDDVNTVRFVDLLREMSGGTQFIVITHNKLTMEAASTLYGVTMEEKGVSKLVSVELEDVQPAERATA